jgi:hypothetical protein
MQNSVKVSLTAFKRKNDVELNGFASILVENGKDKEFEVFRATLDKLATESADYSTKLQKAQNKGKVEIEEKDIAKEKLLLTMCEYAYYVTGAAVQNPTLVAKSGFIAVSNDNNRSNPNLNLAAPFGLKVSPGTLSGELVLSFQVEDANRVVKTALEISQDNGLTWKNGTYFTGRKHIVKNLPTRKDLLLRVRSLGTYSRESDFSTPIAAFLA